jgi:hypothetical protein
MRYDENSGTEAGSPGIFFVVTYRTGAAPEPSGSATLNYKYLHIFTDSYKLFTVPVDGLV